jgi:alkylation response protein AidB-like acyl-CoA dehydrogenase
MGDPASPVPGRAGPHSAILGEEGRVELAMRGSAGPSSCRRGPQAASALQRAIDHANTRETFGKPIAANQAIQWMIADSETELEAARWLVLRAAWTADQGLDPRHASSMAKLYGAGMVNRVVDRVLQIHGGMGYTRELPIERWYRQMRLLRIFEGTDEMQRLIISRDLLRGFTSIGAHLA